MHSNSLQLIRYYLLITHPHVIGTRVERHARLVEQASLFAWFCKIYVIGLLHDEVEQSLW